MCRRAWCVEYLGPSRRSFPVGFPLCARGFAACGNARFGGRPRRYRRPPPRQSNPSRHRRRRRGASSRMVHHEQCHACGARELDYCVHGVRAGRVVVPVLADTCAKPSRMFFSLRKGCSTQNQLAAAKSKEHLTCRPNQLRRSAALPLGNETSAPQPLRNPRPFLLVISDPFRTLAQRSPMHCRVLASQERADRVTRAHDPASVPRRRHLFLTVVDVCAPKRRRPGGCVFNAE